MLRTRILSAIVMLPVVAALVYLGGYWLLGGMLLVAGIACYEFYQLLRQADAAPSWPLGLCLMAGFFLQGARPQWEPWPALAISLLLMGTLIWHMLQHRTTPATDWLVTTAGALYLGWLAGRFVALRDLPDGMLWLTLSLASTWITDSGAYSVGRRWGRHKLAPRLSPKKTREGAIGGWLIGVALTPLLAWLLGLSVLHGLAIGVLAASLAPFGDLAESMFKRQVGAKDSSHLIPGHGGMLDRIDSLLFVIPACYFYVLLAAS